MGEVAPALYARSDVEAYRRALKTLLNGTVMRTGGVQSRPGTVYKGATKSSGAARLVPCVFDDDQNYLLEFGDEYVRFWRDGTLVTVAPGAVATWVTATGYDRGDLVESTAVAGILYICIADHASGAGTEPGIGASWQTVWYQLPATGGSSDPSVIELPTPYADTIRRELQFVITVGEFRIAHRTLPMRKLVRVSDTQWYLEIIETSATEAPVNLANDGTAGAAGTKWVVTAYDAVNDIESLPSAETTSSDTPSSGAGAIALSWDAVAGATGYNVYRGTGSGNFYWVAEVAANSYSDEGTAALITRQPPAEVTEIDTSGTYPGVLGAFQQRILISGSTNAPDYCRGSRTGSPDDFSVRTPLQDSDAISWRMVSDRVVRPRHFMDIGGKLWQFTNIGEGPIEGDESGILSPTAINPRFESKNGAASYPSPLGVDRAALYVQARGSAVWDLMPDGSGSELTVTASHLVDGHRIVEWCYQQTPHGIVWAVRDDGVLLSLTYNQRTGVFAWARHTTDGTVESVACVPEDDEDAVYLIVNRTIDSATVRYVERMANRLAAITALVCVDAATVHTPGGTTGTSITGLDHLEGKSVSVVGIHNGAATVLASPLNTGVYPTTYTVSAGGAISGAALAGYTTLIIGLPFVMDVQTLDIDSGGGSSRKDAGYNLTRLGVWLEDSRDFFAGPEAPSTATSVSTLQRIPMRDGDGNDVTTPVSGYREGALDGLWQESGSVFLRHVDPTPVTFLALIPHGTAGRS